MLQPKHFVCSNQLHGCWPTLVASRRTVLRESESALVTNNHWTSPWEWECFYSRGCWRCCWLTQPLLFFQPEVSDGWINGWWLTLSTNTSTSSTAAGRPCGFTENCVTGEWLKHHKDDIDGEDENGFLHRDGNHLHEDEDVDKDGDLHEHEHGVSRRPLQPHNLFRE